MYIISNPSLRDVGTSERTGRQIYELVEPLVFTLFLSGDNNETGKIQLVVPAGFKTDFASITRWLWPFFPPFGKYSRAAIVHDYLYEVKGDHSRFLADALFRELMDKLGVPLWKRMIMYGAVRLAGWLFW